VRRRDMVNKLKMRKEFPCGAEFDGIVNPTPHADFIGGLMVSVKGPKGKMPEIFASCPEELAMPLKKGGDAVRVRVTRSWPPAFRVAALNAA
jgi:hypothetical protein